MMLNNVFYFDKWLWHYLKMDNNLIKIIIVCLTILLGVYIFTQNTGFNACYKQHEKLYSKEDFAKYNYDEQSAYNCGKRG
jgi:hypothetical protein